MVGVPALPWWLCGPSSRIDCPIERRRSVRIAHGPSSRQSNSAVSAAPADRNVM